MAFNFRTTTRDLTWRLFNIFASASSSPLSRWLAVTAGGCVFRIVSYGGGMKCTKWTEPENSPSNNNSLLPNICRYCCVFCVQAASFLHFNIASWQCNFDALNGPFTLRYGVVPFNSYIDTDRIDRYLVLTNQNVPPNARWHHHVCVCVYCDSICALHALNRHWYPMFWFLFYALHM